MEYIAPSQTMDRKDLINPFIVENILREVVAVTDPKDPTNLHCLLSYGSKVLEVFYHAESQDFSTVITTDNQATKQEQETTYVYAAAKKLIVTLTNKHKVTTRYDLITENHKIRSWAETKGRELFSWDRVDVLEPHLPGGPPIYKFTKSFTA